MATSKKKKDNVGNNSGNVGYSEQALAALDTGTYGTTTNRKPKATTSSSQVTITKTIPVLNGASTTTTISSSPSATTRTQSSAQPVSKTKNPSRTTSERGINTTRARQNYASRTNYTPIKTSLTKKDEETLYKFFDRNRTNIKTSGTAPIITQLKNDIWADTKEWETRYGKPIEQIVEEYAKDWDSISARKDKEYGDKHPVLATIKNVINGGTTEAAVDLAATAVNTVAPNSNLAKAYKNATEAYSKKKAQTKEGVTSDMSDVGKTIYDVGTNAAERVIQYASPSKAKYLLTLGKTAENTRQNLKERGIDDTSGSARAQSLAAGAVDTALDVYGLDKIKGLKGLQESGNLVKSLIGSAAIGGGEQALTSIINEAVDRIANKDKSIYNTNVQNYMAQGMSENDAKDKAWSDEIDTILQETGMGAVVGATMGTGGKVAKKAANTLVDAATGRQIPKLWTPKKTDPVIDKAIKQADQATSEIEKLRQQIPETSDDVIETPQEIRNERNLERIQDTLPNNIGKKRPFIELSEEAQRAQSALEAERMGLPLSEGEQAALDSVRNRIETPEPVNRVAAEKAETNPTLTRKVEPLQGEAKTKAQAEVKSNKAQIKALNNEIDILKNDPKSQYRGKLKKAVKAEIDAKKSQIAELQGRNKAVTREIKGEPTPVVEELGLQNEVKNIKNEIRKVGNMWVGGDAGKQLVKDINKSLDDYIETGNDQTLRDLYASMYQLHTMATNEYTSQKGNVSRYTDYYPNEDGILESIISPKGFIGSVIRTVGDYHKSLNTPAGESAPVDRITENIEPPVTETPVDNVPPTNDEGIIPPNDGGNVPPIPPETPDLEYPDGGDRVRSFSRRGSQDDTLPEEVRNILAEDTYKVVRNADVETRANELFDPENTAQTMSNLNRAVENHDPAAALLSYKLAKTYFDEGNYDAGLDAIEKVSAELTRSGQFTQAAKLAMMQNDPMAALRSYTRDLDRLNQWGNKKYKNKWNDLELSQEDIDLFNSVQKGDAEALSNVVDQLNSKFGKQIPANLWDKAVAASKTSMLLNMRTQGRNIVSNLAMLPLRSASDRVSALGQNIVHLINPDVKVTQSLTGGSKQQKEIATQIWDRLKDDITGENKMKDSVQSDILSHRQIFNDDWFAKWIDNITNGGVQGLNERLGGDANRSTMETLSNFTYWLMGDFGDTPFVKKNFVNRLASYMKAQGIDKVEDVPDDAIAIATQEALKATFKDDNAFSNALANVKKSTGKFGEVALPFVKTPANLAMRGIDYSPAGLVNTFRKIKSGAEASTVIDELAKNLTGTAMIYLGYKLRQNDLLSGNYSDDSDEKAWQKQQGMLENAIHIGDNYYTVDWAQPSATPLIIGSTIYDAINASDNDNNNVLDTVNTTYRGATAVANSWLNTSPLQSLSELLGGSDYSGSTAENIANTIIEFPQRFVPAQLGATARTIDPVMRDTYESDDTLTGILGNQTRQLQAKIPYLSRELPISYDTWGNPRTRSDSTAEAFFAQNLNPGQLGNKNETPIDAEIQRIFDATGDSGVFPWAAARSLDLGNDGKIKLTNEQHSEYQKTLGQLSYNLAEGIINSSEFKALSDDEKAETLNKAYKFANQVSKEELFNHTTDQNKKLMAAYRENGVNGAVNYLVGKDTAEKKEEKTATPKTTTTKTNTVANTVPKMEQSKANDQKQQKQSSASDLGIKQDTYAKIGNKAGKNAEKVYNAIPSLKRNGLGSSSAYYTYADALSVDPNLSTADFIKTFNSIDADNSKGIKQDELITYFNGNNVSQEQANKYWKMYGDPEWKKIPKLEGGKYKKVAK